MKRNFYTILISLIFFTFSQFSYSQTEQKELTLKDIFQSGKFYPKMAYGIKSMADGQSYTLLKNDSLNVYSYKSGKIIKTIVTANRLIPEGDTVHIRFRSYKFSKDEQKILIPTETEFIYRHSSKSNYYIWNIQNEKLSQLSENGKQRLADFSPDGSMVAFVRDNNLFIKNLETGNEEQITKDGLFSHIINGTTDWVYEEEFSFTKAFFWSPDRAKIAFYRFDESNVKEYCLTMFGDLYPEEYKYKYPKAGEDNSVVEIFVYDLDSKSTEKMNIGEEIDQYIPRIKWTTDPNVIAIFRLNRLQNKLEILLNNVKTGNSRILYTEENKYYIDDSNYDNLIFFDDNIHFLFTSEKDGFNHIYLYNMDGELVRQLTKGKWDVTDLLGYDEKKQLAFYISAEVSPLDRDLYAVRLDGYKTRLSQRQGTNSASFSSTYKYYVNTYSDANTPPYITVNKANGKQIRVLKDNDALIERLKEYSYSKKEFFSFNTSEGVELNGWRILPVNFNPTKKYPVLMYVYGGPGSQTVRNRWGGNLWYQLLAQKGIMIVSVDNRGTGARGEEFKKMTYLQLGKYETIDLIEAAKYLGTLDYVDPGKIGIFGWSYGGYMSTLCLTKGADFFSVGIAVAPVTNWRYYDNIYTERFMRTPQENPEGYDDNSPINHVDKFKGKYLLVHGMADDNVHHQNSMDLITALVNANKQFEMQLYPNKNHGIYGGNTTMHLYKRMTDFIFENLLQ